MRLLAKNPKLRRLFLLAERMVRGIIAGNYRSIFRGRGVEFDETREYSYGDPVRLMDWNVTARRQIPHTKVFKEEREVTLFFIVDISASIFFSHGETQTIEITSQVLTLLALAACSNSDKVGALFFGDAIEKFYPPRKDYRHILNIVSLFEKLSKKNAGTRLDKALRMTNRFLKKRGVCVIISDFKTEQYERDLSLLVKKHTVIAIKINDDVLGKLSNVGTIPIIDSETSVKTHLFTGSIHYRQGMQEYWNKKHQQWIKTCTKLGVLYVSLGGDEDPMEVLLRFFRRNVQ